MSNLSVAETPALSKAATNVALATHMLTLVTFLVASSAPTPLYRLYQAQWHFSPTVLTVIFSTYALALLASLLIAGRLSDHVGRLPVIRWGLALEIVAMGLFLVAQTPGWLVAARLVQGVATGLVSAAIGAALIDLDRERGSLVNSLAPMVGMGIGALISTALSELAPEPTHLVFALLVAAFAVQLLLTTRMPETASGREGGQAGGRAGGRAGVLRTLRPRIAVPAQARGALLKVTPLNAALWALGGFYLSLMPSLIGKVTGSHSAWLGGLAVAILTLSGGAATLLMRRFEARTGLLVGALALIAGVPAILAGAHLGLPGILLAGSLTAGIGFGSGFLGAFRTVMPLAAPDERAGLLAAFYVESYLAHSLPAILAGYLAQRFDLLTVATLYGGAVWALVLLGLVLAYLSEAESARL